MSMADERVDLYESDLDLGKQGEENKRLSRRQSNSSSKGKGRSEAEEPVKPSRSRAARVTLWLLRKSIVPLIMVIMLVAGLYAGYTIVGKGEASDVFHWSTWKHMYDLVFSDS